MAGAVLCLVAGVALANSGLTIKTESLRGDLSEAVRVARFGDGAKLAGTPVDREQVAGFEKRLHDAHDAAEKAVVSDRPDVIEQAATQVADYFESLRMYAYLRAMSGDRSRLGADWGISVPREVFDAMPEIGEVDVARSSGLRAELSVSSEWGRVRIFLGQGFFDELDAFSAIRGLDGESALFSALKFLSTREELLRWADAKLLLTDARSKVPAVSIPASLQSQYPSFAQLDSLLDSYRASRLESALRAKMGSETKELVEEVAYPGDIPAFKTLISTLRLQDRIDNIRKTANESFTEQLTLFPYSLSEMGSDDAAAKITLWAVNAWVDAVLAEMKDPEHEAPRFNNQQLDRLREQSYELNAALIGKIPKEGVTRWYLGMREAAEGMIGEEARVELARTLLDASAEVESLRRAVSQGFWSRRFHSIHVMNMDEDFQPVFGPWPQFITKGGPSQGWFERVMGAGSYAGMRKAYETVVTELLGKGVLTAEGHVDLEKARAAAKNYVRTPLKMGAAELDPEHVKYLEKARQDSSRAELGKFVDLGAAMGFTFWFSDQQPKVSNILRKFGQRRSYYGTKLQSGYYEKLWVLAMDSDRSKVPVSARLADIAGDTPAGKYSEKQLAEAGQVLEFVLVRAAQKAQDEIDRIGSKVRSLEDMAPFATAPLASELIAKEFPELTRELERWREAHGRLTGIDRFFQRYVGRWAAATGLPMLFELVITKGIRKRFPMLGAFLESPPVKAFNRFAMGLMIVETGYSVTEVMKKRRELQRTANLYYSSIYGEPLVPIGEYDAMKKAYRHARNMNIISVAMLSPMLLELKPALRNAAWIRMMMNATPEERAELIKFRESLGNVEKIGASE